MDNGSGDYVIAFSTHPGVRRRPQEARRTVIDLANDSLSGLFRAAAEATEEAIYNSLFMATTVRSRNATVDELPVAEVLRLLKERHALNPTEPSGPK
jgi:D-aminopeptidase